MKLLNLIFISLLVVPIADAETSTSVRDFDFSIHGKNIRLSPQSREYRAWAAFFQNGKATSRNRAIWAQHCKILLLEAGLHAKSPLAATDFIVSLEILATQTGSFKIADLGIAGFDATGDVEVVAKTAAGRTLYSTEKVGLFCQAGLEVLFRSRYFRGAILPDSFGNVATASNVDF